MIMCKLRKRALRTMCILVILLSFGCAGLLNGNYGKIVPDGNVMHAFESYQVNPDLNYYISGSDVYPNAIMGIDKRYSLNSTLWKKVEFTPQTLKSLVDNMKAKVSEINQTLHGFTILDTKGNDIGNWYSILNIMGSADYSCSNLIQGYDFNLCPDMTNGKCGGEYTMWYERYACTVSTSEGYCEGTGVIGNIYSDCVEDLNSNPGQCASSGNYFSRFLRACQP